MDDIDGGEAPRSRPGAIPRDPGIAYEIVVSAADGADDGRSLHLPFEPLDVPATHSGSIAVKLLAANRFQILDKIREPLTMLGPVMARSDAPISEANILNVEAAGRRAITAAAIVPRGLPTALVDEMTGLCRVGGRLMRLSALLRREQVVSQREFERVRAKTAEAVADLDQRIGRMQAGLPWELEELLACRDLVMKRARLGQLATALVRLWLGSERQNAVYAALGGEDQAPGPARPPRSRERGGSAVRRSAARELLGIGPSGSFDEAVDALVREIDAAAPDVVACASALDERPVIRCRECIDALAAFTRGTPAKRRRRRGPAADSTTGRPAPL